MEVQQKSKYFLHELVSFESTVLNNSEDLMLCTLPEENGFKEETAGDLERPSLALP